MSLCEGLLLILDHKVGKGTAGRRSTQSVAFSAQAALGSDDVPIGLREIKSHHASQPFEVLMSLGYKNTDYIHRAEVTTSKLPTVHSSPVKPATGPVWEPVREPGLPVSIEFKKGDHRVQYQGPH